MLPRYNCFPSPMKIPTSYKHATVVLWVFALLIILWGAWVRISGSGDGCGESWPLCHGEVLPSALHKKTWVEFLHRATSGLFGILAVGVAIWSYKIFPKRHPSRYAALLTLLFTITEALLGAKLVLSGLVGSNQSSARAVTVSLHLLNTLILLSTIVALALFSGAKEWKFTFYKGKERILFIASLLVFLAVTSTGSWAALAGVLFPSKTLFDGVAADLSPTSHFLIRLRMFHPFIAIAAFAILVSFGHRVSELLDPSQRWMGGAFARLVTAALVFGGATLLFLSPQWMKVTHLLIADLTWSAFVALSILSCSSVKTNEARNPL